MTSWSFLPLEIKALILEYVLSSISKITHDNLHDGRHGCIESFPRMYAGFCANTRPRDAANLRIRQSFIGFVADSYSARALLFCLLETIHGGRRTLYGLLKVAPEIINVVQARLAKEYVAAHAGLSDDCRRRAVDGGSGIDAVDAIRKVVMLDLCRVSYISERDALAGKNKEQYQEWRRYPWF